MKVHTVQKGDSLWKISKLHGLTLDELIAANPQIANPDQLEVGMVVKLPDGGPGTPMPIEGEGPGSSTVPSAQEPKKEVEGPGTHVSPSHAPINVGTGGPAPAYPSVPKWDGLWKYVVKQGDSMFKIAKQVGVTLDQLKAANPQVPNADSIYVGQVLNIPSAGLKPKYGNNPGHSSPMSKEQLTAPIVQPPLMPKEQLTAPIVQPPLMPKEQLTAPIFQPPLMPKEQLTLPKEMAPVEQPIVHPPVVHPPQMVSPIEMNIQYAPHMNYAPHEENVQVQQMQMMPQPVQHHPMMLMYIPVSHKKKHKKHKKCCHKKTKHHVCKCGGHKHHFIHPQLHLYGNVHHDTMLYHQHMQMAHGGGMGMMPKTFYREDE
ncbi:LysM peptidoglycan-binding domain-containing protein [Tumebacillus algifaecis]|uniref:LysM peptidoglycan-binding domain-containing protein n=1 Tax=Tumebacillus algifaecis TaxID=1214604 RepID=UPI0012FE73CA|nr:LysM domain-containing protein [Tumebacillus algifaecis]